MDIGSRNGYPASALSNFAPHLFVFDDVPCASMEGLLQAFKFDKEHIQVVVCTLVGMAAKRRGGSRNWRRAQTLWWKGVSYDRHGADYQALLDRAYGALFTNEAFQRALAATGDASLTHSVGKSNPSDTVLTEREFCARLERLRDRLLKK